MKKIAVIGCGRSGTTYTSEVLKGLGLDVGHEVMGSDGIVWWKYTTKGNLLSDFQKVIHVIRDPADMIASMLTIQDANWKYICKKMPVIGRYKTKLEKGAAYWLYWNKAAESQADRTFRVEDLRDGGVPELAEYLGVPMVDAAQATSPKTNSRKGRKTHLKRKVTASDIPSLADEVKKYADKHGYTFK